VTISVGSGSGALQGTVTATAKNGIATFSNLAAASPGTVTLVASDSNSNLSIATSSSITIGNPPGVSPVGAATYSISGYPGTETLDVLSGTVDLTSDQSVNFPSVGLRIESGATVVLQSFQQLGGLQVIGSGVLDVDQNGFYLNYGAGSDPINTIVGWITSAYAGGTWTGTGITSSAAGADPASFGVGYADSADAGNPALLAADQIKVIYTLLGDANLDGKVNGTDFNLMSANFNQAVTNGWDEGDFNYDGKVNGTDFVLLSDNFNQFVSQSGVVATTDSATTDSATTDSAGSTQTTTTDSASGGNDVVSTVLGKHAAKKKQHD
jgi:hypothetical protein